MVCFVILHYMTEQETISCVNDIMHLDGDKEIVIVDNASPNNSGERLVQRYRDLNNVTVIVNDENGGYAKGNNVGYKYAKDKFKPDYIVVMNNDIHIYQKDFISKLCELYDKERYAVLGPDVFVDKLKIHQNPKRLKSYSYDEVKALENKYRKMCASTISLRIRCMLKSVNILKRFVYNRRMRKNQIDYSKTYFDIPLHGSCIIFSQEYIEVRDNAFFDKTFMYYETEILDYECHKLNLKAMYSPEIKVLHNHNISTNTAFESQLKRTQFMNENILFSLTEFKKLMESDMG